MLRAVVLLSGGIDSATCLGIARDKYKPEEILCLNLYYGQKHSVERNAADRIAAYFNVSLAQMSLNTDIFKGGGSTLIDPGAETPSETYASMAEKSGVSPTYVPFRNANLLSAATALALTQRPKEQPDDIFTELYYGAHAEDAAGWAYPDCTPEFNGAMANAIFIGTYFKVRLITPLQWCSKAEVIHMARYYNVPLELTYSCYRGTPNHCGTCPTCIGRAKAFRDAEINDPTTYAVQPQ